MANEIVPIFDPDRSFRVWSINEIYDGISDNSYVPNINDAVWDWATGLYRVSNVDIETGLSTLEKYQPIIENPYINEDDILTGAVPGRVCESYRLYLNNSTDPVTAAIDSRLYIYGSDNKYVRLFKGFDISIKGDVVSLFYNDNNELIDDKIPLELAVTIEGSNKTVKTPLAGYCSKGLEDGEVVTCVVYSDTGIVTSINPLLVKNTGFIRGVNDDNLYISKIVLKSPFLSADNEDLLEVPLNTPLNNLDLSVDVIYSSGNRKNCLVDNKKITVDGIEAFRVSQKNQTSPVIVTYHFGDNEANYSATSDNGRAISKVYQITTLPPLSKGIVKIFVIPIYDNVLKGWNLTYYLYNLDRSLSLDVTNLVKVVEPAGQGFEPTNYGNLQILQLSLDIKDITVLDVENIYSQNFEITLFSLMGESYPSWTMKYIDGGEKIYGETQFAKFRRISDRVTVDISQGLGDINSWLNTMYYSLYPLHSSEEKKPLDPSHLIMEYKEHSVEVVILNYDYLIDFPIMPAIGDTVICRWVKRVESEDLQLAIGPLSVIGEIT